MRLGTLILESFADTLAAEDAAVLIPWFDTPEGKETFREMWPKIVDAYFNVLCNPKARAASTP